jgi:hypothetical protein
VALRAFLDSSGKIENKKDRFLTLAAVAGDDSMWSVLEKGWDEILDSHSPKATYVHMREIFHLKKGFDESLGWDHSKGFDLATKCVIYLSRIEKTALQMFYCSVDLFAWRKLRQETYQMPEPIDLCNTFCSESVLGWYVVKRPGMFDAGERVKYFFDRHEYFENPFKEKWHRERCQSEATGDWGIWNLIDEVAPVEMQTTPGIQAADIIAWSMNRETFAAENEAGRYMGHIIRQVIPSRYIVWNEEKLRQQFKPLIHLP